MPLTLPLHSTIAIINGTDEQQRFNVSIALDLFHSANVIIKVEAIKVITELYITISFSSAVFFLDIAG